MVAHLAGHRRQRLQIGKEVADVLDLGMLIGRVGKRREIMRARRRGPLEHGGDEFGLAPSPDAVGRIGRDVRRHRTCRTATGSRARRRASGDRAGSGTAWQEEHPPALNVVTPLARFGRVGRQRSSQRPPPGSSATRKCREPATPARTAQGEFVAAFTDPSLTPQTSGQYGRYFQP